MGATSSRLVSASTGSGIAEYNQNPCIAVKEIFPILLAAALYGKDYTGCTVLYRCDYIAVVAILKSRYAKDRRLMHLLRVLFFLEAHYNFVVIAQHLPGVHN